MLKQAGSVTGCEREKERRENAVQKAEKEEKKEALAAPSCSTFSSHAMWLLDWIVSLNTAVVKLASGLRCK